MPVTPTHQRPGRASGHSGAREKQRPQRPQEEKRSELVCRVKYQNSLPDIPFDPKFLSYPFDPSRFVTYKPTSLERNYKYELLTEHDLGITVDLILPEIFANPPMDETLELDPKDEKLLEEDYGAGTDIKRSQRHAKILSWMRKPDYISTEQTRYQPTTIEKIESRIGFANRKKMGEEHAVYMDRDTQIAKIEKTFDDAKVAIEHHHSKKGVYAEAVYPIVPDDEMWKYPCAQVIFDSDPAPAGHSQILQNAMMEQVDVLLHSLFV